MAIRRNPNLDPFEGEWVMTLNGEVICHASSSTELVRKARERFMPFEIAGCVMEYVHPPTKAGVVW